MLVYVALALAIAIVTAAWGRTRSPRGLARRRLLRLWLRAGDPALSRSVRDTSPTRAFRIGFPSRSGTGTRSASWRRSGSSSRSASSRTARRLGLRRSWGLRFSPCSPLTPYFTFSRGAWAALAIGVALGVVLDPRRLALLWSTSSSRARRSPSSRTRSRQDALTTEDAPSARQRAKGIAWRAALDRAHARLGPARHGSPGVVSRRVVVTPRRQPTRRLPLSRGRCARRRHDRARRCRRPDARVSRARGALRRNRSVTARSQRPPLQLSGNGRERDQLAVAWEAAPERPLVGQAPERTSTSGTNGDPALRWSATRHSLYAETLSRDRCCRASLSRA